VTDWARHPNAYVIDATGGGPQLGDHPQDLREQVSGDGVLGHLEHQIYRAATIPCCAVAV